MFSAKHVFKHLLNFQLYVLPFQWWYIYYIHIHMDHPSLP